MGIFDILEELVVMRDAGEITTKEEWVAECDRIWDNLSEEELKAIAEDRDQSERLDLLRAHLDLLNIKKALGGDITDDIKRMEGEL